MTAFPRYYGAGAGFVVTGGGDRLSKSAATAALARETALSKDLTVTAGLRAQAGLKARQLADAIERSFNP